MRPGPRCPFRHTFCAHLSGNLAPHHFGNPALFALHHLLQAGQAVGDGMIAHFDTDVAPPHLVRHRRRGAGTEEGVEDEVAEVGSNVHYSFDKALWFWCAKNIVLKKYDGFLFCFLRMPYFRIRPKGLGDNTLFDFI